MQEINWKIPLRRNKISHQLTINNLSLREDHTGGKWFIHGPKHRKKNQLLRTTSVRKGQATLGYPYPH